jgi:hypothetical protein
MSSSTSTSDFLTSNGNSSNESISRSSQQEYESSVVTADSRQQADGRQQTGDSRQQTADSRQQTADNRQQTADSRQRTGDSEDTPDDCTDIGQQLGDTHTYCFHLRMVLQWCCSGVAVVLQCCYKGVTA